MGDYAHNLNNMNKEKNKMDIHELRKRIDELVYAVEQIENNEVMSKEEPRLRSLVKTKLQEAKMWAGQILGAQSKPLPKEYRDFCEEREKKVE